MDPHDKRTFAKLAIVCCAITGMTGGAILAPEPGSPKELHASAQREYGRVDSYIARLTRQETFKGKRRPEEVVLLKFREEPWSVYAKWLGKEGQNREGVYVKGKHGGKVHVRLAAGDVLFMPAGARMSLAPDGALLRAASSHPITDLGIGPALRRISNILDALERGDRRMGELTLVGPERRDEFARPVRGIQHEIPAGVDPVVPSGGRRTYWFDPTTGLPTLLSTQDEKGREVEYYHYDRLQLSPGLDDEDFDPDRLWGRRDGSNR